MKIYENKWAVRAYNVYLAFIVGKLLWAWINTNVSAA